MNITLNSHNRQIATCPTVKVAKELAINESNMFDDVVTIEVDGVEKFMAHYGTLYRLTPTR